MIIYGILSATNCVMYELSDLIKDNVNVIEAYFCPENVKDEKILSCGWDAIPNLPIHSFKNRVDYNIVEYNHRDIVYIYDTSNDSQKVIQRNCVFDKIIDNVYIVALNEETLPTHRFPCTKDISHKEKFKKIYYKYNNRIFFHIEEDEVKKYTLSLRYNHAYNVDLVKMSEDWKTIYTIIAKSIYKN